MIPLNRPITVNICTSFVHLPKAQKWVTFPSQDPLTISSMWVSKSPLKSFAEVVLCFLDSFSCFVSFKMRQGEI